MDRLRTAATLASLTLLAACAHPRGDAPLVVDVAGGGADCRVSVAGEQMAGDRLPELVRSTRAEAAVLRLGAGTPYRCIGGLIYRLQQAGVTRIDTEAQTGG